MSNVRGGRGGGVASCGSGEEREDRVMWMKLLVAVRISLGALA